MTEGEWEHLEKDHDRDWYDHEEGGGVDAEHNPFLGSEEKFKEKEKDMAERQAPLTPAPRPPWSYPVPVWRCSGSRHGLRS
jgi:hypothetical protein